jgi:CYTH domain-containing protein
VYRLQLEGLVLAVGPADGPVPTWCRREVTDDAAFSDAALAATQVVPRGARQPVSATGPR